MRISSWISSMLMVSMLIVYTLSPLAVASAIRPVATSTPKPNTIISSVERNPLLITPKPNQRPSKAPRIQATIHPKVMPNASGSLRTTLPISARANQAKNGSTRGKELMTAKPNASPVLKVNRSNAITTPKANINITKAPRHAVQKLNASSFQQMSSPSPIVPSSTPNAFASNGGTTLTNDALQDIASQFRDANGLHQQSNQILTICLIPNGLQGTCHGGIVHDGMNIGVPEGYQVIVLPNGDLRIELINDASRNPSSTPPPAPTSFQAIVNNGQVVSSVPVQISSAVTGVGFQPSNTSGPTVYEPHLELAVGQTTTLNVRVETALPSTAAYATTWISDQPNIASVHPTTGLITALQNGIAKITVTTVDGGFTANAFIHVFTPVASVNIGPATMNKMTGDVFTLTAMVLPLQASDQNVTWTSSNPAVATIAQNGYVEALTPGTTILKATANNGVFGQMTLTVSVSTVAPVANFQAPSSKKSTDSFVVLNTSTQLFDPKVGSKLRNIITEEVTNYGKSSYKWTVTNSNGVDITNSVVRSSVGSSCYSEETSSFVQPALMYLFALDHCKNLEIYYPLLAGSYTLTLTVTRLDNGLQSTISKPLIIKKALTTIEAQGQMDAGGYHSLAIKNQDVFAWGANWNGQTTVPTISDVKAVSAGEQHSLALKSDGTVVAWGGSSYGQIWVPDGLDQVSSISAGQYHSLALKTDGTVVGWGGYYGYGQANIPSNLNNVIAISAGGSHSMALKSDGTIQAWGRHWEGQLSVPSGLNNVIAISAGGWHNLALKSDGTVVAWGSDFYGQSTIPSGLNNVIAISAGYNHSLALKSDGTVVAWGLNNNDQTTIPNGLTNVIAISAGTDHSLALKSDGTIVAWGDRSSGKINVPSSLVELNRIQTYALDRRLQLHWFGLYHTRFDVYLDDVKQNTQPLTNNAWVSEQNLINGKRYKLTVKSLDEDGLETGHQVTTYATPVAVQMDAGGEHSLAIKNNQINGWGYQTHNRTTAPNGLTNVISISAGGDHSLALTADGTVVGWGYNISGQTWVPSNLDHVVSISAGGYHSLALKSDGTVVGWGGAYGYGQASIPSGLNNVIAISAGGSHSLALQLDGTVQAWGRHWEGQIGVPSEAKNVIAISAGGSHSLALKSDGTVVAWGADDVGQSTIPSGLSNVIAISAGGSHSLALKSDGTVVAWGWNEHDISTVPVGLSNVIAISAGGMHSLALKSDGTIVAWGYNGSTQTNIPSSLQTPVDNTLFMSQNNNIVIQSAWTYSSGMTGLRTIGWIIHPQARNGYPLKNPATGANELAYVIPEGGLQGFTRTDSVQNPTPGTEVVTTWTIPKATIDALLPVIGLPVQAGTVFHLSPQFGDMTLGIPSNATYNDKDIAKVWLQNQGSTNTQWVDSRYDKRFTY